MSFEDEVAREQQRFIDRYDAAVAVLRRVPGVVSVGVGARERRGEIMPELAFRVYVPAKVDEAVLPPSYRVPKVVCGLPTDVIVKPDIDEIQSSSSAAPFAPNWDSEKYRPLIGGCQIRTEKFEGDNKRAVGTLGCMGLMIDGTIVGLTAQHIACAGTEYNVGAGPASSTSSGGAGGGTSFACVGTKVGQPRHITCCCCCTFNEIGAVLRATKTAQLDCATVKLDDDTKSKVVSGGTLNDILEIGTLTGTAQAVCFSEVRKRGAATRLTRGTVVDVLYEGSQILIAPLPGFPTFAYYGDSGAVIVDSANRVVGLLWGASRSARARGVANHIGPVLVAMGITIAGGTEAGLGIPATSCGSSAPGPGSSSTSSTSSSSSGRPSSSSSSSRSSSSSSSSSSQSSSSSSSRSSSSSSSSSAACANAILGPANVPGLSEYRYRIDAPTGSTLAGINWTVTGATASIVGAQNQRDVTIRFTNAQADWVRIRVDFTLDGNPACGQRHVAVVQVTVDPAVFTTAGRPGSTAPANKSFLVNPPALPALPKWITNFTPGSNCGAFVYNGTQQAAEPRRRLESSGGGGGSAFGISAKVTLTSPAQKPTAHQQIQIGYIQHGSESGGSTYTPNGIRTVTVPAAVALDWLSAVCTPAGTDDWPWYDQSARDRGAGASPWTATLSMSDSPMCSVPAGFDPNHPADPRSANALNTAAESFSCTLHMAVRTMDADLKANERYFEAGHTTWRADFAFPVVAGVSIITTGPAAWIVPPNPSEISVNIVPAVTNGNGPFMRWIPT